jgi:TRAP-type mannitol/chloroaromatic compound transport system permease small subunit
MRNYYSDYKNRENFSIDFFNTLYFSLPEYIHYSLPFLWNSLDDIKLQRNITTS